MSTNTPTDTEAYHLLPIPFYHYHFEILMNKGKLEADKEWK
jgi:hypothetical protein